MQTPIAMKPRLTKVENTVLAYSTPVNQVRFENIDEFNAEVARRVLAMRDQVPGVRYSNVGGWQSNSNFLQDLGEPYASQLAWMFMSGVYGAMRAVVTLAEDPRIQPVLECWANVNERGNLNLLHIHPGSPWSGVYYVATDIKAHGEIYFMDPRVAALMSVHPLNPFNVTNSFNVAPTPGMLLVFPSFLPHGVYPYEGNSPRISIAFNLM